MITTILETKVKMEKAKLKTKTFDEQNKFERREREAVCKSNPKKIASRMFQGYLLLKNRQQESEHPPEDSVGGSPHLQ